ncbi:hypothetical protein D3C80_1235430 [compost metagenome]
MKINIPKLKSVVSVLLLILILVPIGVLIIAILPLFLLLISKPNQVVRDQAYRTYLRSIEGTKFFCYNNRRNSEDYIERYVIPNLPPDVKLIYLDGKIPLSDYEKEFISTALYRIKDRGGFPYLLRVVDGEMLDCSVNNEFYNMLNQHKNPDKLLRQINEFYNYV